MLEHINLHSSYVTTSSCSGRIALFVDTAHDDERQRGKGGKWLLCAHDEIRIEEVMDALDKAQTTPGLVYLKAEPFIMHVQCKSLDDACKFLETAKVAGFRESGISPGYKATALLCLCTFLPFLI
jgi:tRNA wybutosine-synthesizing protein 3